MTLNRTDLGDLNLFRGIAGDGDKIVPLDPESGQAETNVQSEVRDRGGDAGDGAGRVGPAGAP